MTRTDENGGIEYAVRREKDGAYLFDADMDGLDASWEDDEDNATWVETPAMALALADMNGLTTDDEKGDPLLDDGYRIVSRTWVNEEDLEDDGQPGGEAW